MTEVAILQTADRDRDAGLSLGRQIRDRLSGPPDAIIVFAAPGNDFQALLSALAESTDTTTIVGCSSAGEFTNDESGVGLTNATAIRASDMRFTASVGTGLTTDYARAAHDLAQRFQANRHPELPHRAALVLVDALAGHAEEFVSALTVETSG